MAYRYGTRNDELPLNMLDKLFFAVRTPEEGFEPDDLAWVASDGVANWRRGWDILCEAGYVEVQMAEDPESGDWFHAVRFTKGGLTIAIERNISPVVQDLAVTVAEEKAVIEQREQYESNALFGML